MWWKKQNKDIIVVLKYLSKHNEKQIIIFLIALIIISIHTYEIITNEIERIWDWFVLASLILIQTF